MDYLNKIIQWKREGKKIVFTNGCFDILHAGHVDYLEKAKKLGDILVVGLNSDLSISRIKGNKRPILEEDLRKKVLEGLKAVDLVIIFNEDTPERVIKEIKPDILVKGGDWDIESIVGADFVKSYGGKVKTIDFTYDISTTKIIKRILDRYCDNR